MKKYKLLKSGLFVLTLALFFASCADDDGADPNIPGSDRDKYVGEWICAETVSGGPTNSFTITIQKHGSDDTLYVYNFNNIGAPTYAIWLISGNSVTIPSQTILQIDVGGSGFYDDGTINLNYTSDGESMTAVCSE